MCCMENSIYVNDSDVGLFAASKTGVDHPHTSSLIWCIPNVIKPMDNSTAVVVSLSLEREEAEDMSNIHTMHSFKLRVGNDEYTIILRALLSPSWCGMNIFALHAASATKITGSIEC